jgi:hypothetical protein
MLIILHNDIMAPWTDTFDATFWLAIGSLSSAGFALLLKYMLKSKCQKFNCCFGLFVIDRDIEAELEEDRIELGMDERSSTNQKDLQIVRSVGEDPGGGIRRLQIDSDNQHMETRV